MNEKRIINTICDRHYNNIIEIHLISLTLDRVSFTIMQAP